MLKKRILSNLIFFMLSVYLAAFLVNYIDSFLRKVKNKSFYPHIQIASVFESEPKRLMFLLVMLMAVTFILYINVNSYFSVFRNHTRKIAGYIETPERSGNNEYGGARFLNSKEYREVFEKCTINYLSPTIQKLKQMGDYDLYKSYDPTKDEIKDIQLYQKGGMIVAFDYKKGEFYAVTNDTHTMIIGATRSSKTRTLIIPSMVFTALAGESMVVSDVKGEIYHYMYPFLMRIGYETIVLNFQEPERSDRYNFMEGIINKLNNSDIAKAKNLTLSLVESLVGNAPKNGETLWTDGNKSILACCIMAVAYDNRKSGNYQNLTNVYHFISKMCKIREKEELPLIKYLDSLDDSHPAKSLAGISEVSYLRTRSSFYSSALATLRLFEDIYIAHMTTKTDFDLEESGTKKRAIFIILPDEKEEYYPIATLFVYQYYQKLVEIARESGGRLKRRVHFFMDEIGNFTAIKSFQTLITVGAGRGIRFHLSLQGINQLEDKYGENASKIIVSNCETWVYLQSDDEKTLEMVSKKLGTYTIKMPTASANTNSVGGSSGYSLGKRELLTTEEVRRIRRPYHIVTSRTFPALCKSPDISKTVFNDMLGLGDEEHNIFVMKRRFENRPKRLVKPVDIWDIAKNYISNEKSQPEESYWQIN